ncbi:hypothetical protein GJ744_003554 [Endocarpon pusillum]|uniref:Isochorismatase-like domain-containing protein n=1 Tax=Endocarpon pusillum TaxID=364733 RepID=A0A8H7AME4_9EURO|nr:hypothetical protein GJ744_003554 [Endocarpon pusillum]
MKPYNLLSVGFIAVAAVSAYTFERLDKENAVLLVVDEQVGLSQLVRDYTPTEFRNNMLAHAALGKLFNLPTILTTSAETGPNGPLPKEITQMYPTIEATGKKQMIVAGITTDVCTTFLALSLREAGYSVWANTDASGTFTANLAADANRRMEQAGVHLMGMFGITMDLMRDWRNTPGLPQVLPFLDQYLPAYGITARAHAGAITNGTLVPGEAELV